MRVGSAATIRFRLSYYTVESYTRNLQRNIVDRACAYNYQSRYAETSNELRRRELTRMTVRARAQGSRVFRVVVKFGVHPAPDMALSPLKENLQHTNPVTISATSDKLVLLTLFCPIHNRINLFY